METFIRRFWPRGQGGKEGRGGMYESLPLTDDRGFPSEEPKDEIRITNQRFEWLEEAAKPGVRLLWALVPFFIARPLGKTDRTLPKTTSTTYLNGIRGLACWIVFNHHMAMKYFKDWLFLPYGALVGDGEDRHPSHHFFQLPLIRVLHCGKGMVCLFFALSGFVLAYSPLRKIISASNDKHSAGAHDGCTESNNEKSAKSEKLSDELLTGFSSGLLRRAIRLFAPLLGLAAITAPLTYFKPADDRADSSKSFAIHIRRNRDWFTDMINPYAWEKIKMPRHYPQAWTLAQEYRLSLALFLVLLATCKLSTVARKFLVAIVGIWSIYCDRRWDVMTFMGGILIAELRFAPLCQDFARLVRRPGIDLNIWVYKIVGTISFIIGLMFCSWPEDQVYKDVQPYKSFRRLIPESWTPFTETELSGAYIWYMGSIGAVLLIWGLEQLPLVQRGLSCAALKYLGEISYALYLVHWIFQHYVFERIYLHMHDTLEWRRNSAFWMAYAPTLFFTIVASDYFWRAIDENCVKLGRFLVTDLLGVGAKNEKRSLPAAHDSALPVQEMQHHHRQ